MQKYIVKERRTIDIYDVRRECIRNSWYTKGTTKEYEEMFSKCRALNDSEAGVDAEGLISIAVDIAEHSDIDKSLFGIEYDSEVIEMVLSILGNECCRDSYIVAEVK